MSGHTLRGKRRADGITPLDCDTCGPVGHINNNRGQITAWTNGNADDRRPANDATDGIGRRSTHATETEAQLAVYDFHQWDLFGKAPTSTSEPPSTQLDDADEMLPREVLAEHAAAHVWARLIAEINTAAEQTAPHQRPSRSATLSRVQILRIISEQAHQLAVSQAIKAVSDGATLSTTAAALGVSRQRVHQLIREQ